MISFALIITQIVMVILKVCDIVQMAWGQALILLWIYLAIKAVRFLILFMLEASE